jgi:predicted DNA-binding transcriptional regulator YafY
MIGWEEDRQAYLTFALDRITEATIVEKKQKRRTDFNPRLFLQHSIGIMEGDGSATLVELELLDPVDKLVLLEPLHPSQEVIRQSSLSTHLQIQVNINPELIQRLLSMGAHCKIKKPKTLRLVVKEELEKALRHYSE